MPICYQSFLDTHIKRKPYALMDLDDTLFQTKRKLIQPICDDSLVVASVNKHNTPLSFLTPTQAHFFAWLSMHTILIPVTARDKMEIKRVLLPFDDIKILTHGAVILDKNGHMDNHWSTIIKNQLLPYQQALCLIQDALEPNNVLRITAHTDTFGDDELIIYLAIKHQDKNHNELLAWASKIPKLCRSLGVNFDDFYIHVNANNLAILPRVIHKQHAVRFIKDTYLQKNTPTFGFGDSLADLGFLVQLDWYGTPNKGQIHTYITEYL